MTARRLLRSAVACSAILVSAGAHANEIIVNGGFEDGVYSSTIDGGTNNVPNGWTASAGWDTLGNFNHVSSFDPHSGSEALYMGNDPGYPIATISQTMTDIAGVTYQASFYLGNIAPTGYFSALLDGNTEVDVSLPLDQTRIIPYILETFTFLGTGKDTLSFSAVNDEASYAVDDVSVSPVARGAPGPIAGTGLPFLVIGFGAYWLMNRRRALSNPIPAGD